MPQAPRSTLAVALWDPNPLRQQRFHGLLPPQAVPVHLHQPCHTAMLQQCRGTRAVGLLQRGFGAESWQDLGTCSYVTAPLCSWA